MNLANLHFLLRTLSWLIENGPSSLRRRMRLDVFPSETRSREKLKHFPAFLGTLFIRTKKLTTFSGIYENIFIQTMLNIRQKRETCTVLLYSIQSPNGFQRWWEWTRLATSLLGLSSPTNARWFAGVGWLTEFATGILPNQNCWMGSRSDWFNLTWNNGTYYIYDGLWHKRHQDHQEKQRNTLNVWTYQSLSIYNVFKARSQKLQCFQQQQRWASSSSGADMQTLRQPTAKFVNRHVWLYVSVDIYIYIYRYIRIAIYYIDI